MVRTHLGFQVGMTGAELAARALPPRVDVGARSFLGRTRAAGTARHGNVVCGLFVAPLVATQARGRVMLQAATRSEILAQRRAAPLQPGPA